MTCSILLFSGTTLAREAEADDTAQQDIIRIASGARTTTLDPSRSIWDGNIETFGQLYSRLLRRDENGQIQGGLAQHWEVSSDGTEYKFFLRPARFSDGSPLGAEDVVYSLLRIRDDPEAAYAEPLRTMADAVAIDKSTVLIRLTQPSASFLEALEMCYYGVVSKSDLEHRGQVNAFAERPVTSGPYRVVRWKPNDRLVLEANPYYWRQGYPLNSGAELIEVADDNTRIAMLLTGEIDAVRSIPWSQLAVLRADDTVRVPHEPATLIWIVLLNHEHPPFNDIRVRQAAAMALDRDLMTRVISRGTATPANTIMPDAINFHLAALPGWSYDLDRAKELIIEAGASGKEVTLIMDAPNAVFEMISVIVQAQWAKIGLKAKIRKMDQALSEQSVIDGDYDGAVSYWLNETFDPDLALKWAVCGSCGNRSFYSNYQNDEVDRLLDEGARSLDPEKRREIYYRVQEIATLEVSQIPLFYPPWLNAYGADIEGLGMTPAMQWTLENARHVH